MGGAIGILGRKKKVDVARRPPLKTADEILGSEEGKARVLDALKGNLPTTPSRWENALATANVDIPVTEEEPDPLRLDLDLDTLHEMLKIMYDRVTSLESEGLTLLREFMPKLYDKHSLDRGLKLSQKERELKGLTDECYAYGELDYEVFTTIFLKVTSCYGMKDKGIFYDLGCGCGSLVYSAAFIGNFQKVAGVDNIGSLLERGDKRGSRWEILKEDFNKEIKNITIEWVEENFLVNNFWKEASFILLHWTAFSVEQRETIGNMMSQLAEGTHVISFTNPIPGTDFITLIQDSCITSWGKADFFFQEKLTKATKLSYAKPTIQGDMVE